MLKPTRSMVLEKLREIFPEERCADALAALDLYGSAPDDQERDRVQLAALKLSAGDLDRLRDLVFTAKGDPRDVIAPAEYPGF